MIGAQGKLESEASSWGEMLPALVNIVKEKPLLRRSISPASSSSERAFFTVMVLLSSAAAIFSMGNTR